MKLGVWGGGVSHAPEFSRPAILGAYVSGADVLRLPLRLTEDGTVVIFEDADTGRQADQRLEIGKSKLRDLRALKMGHSFTDGAGAPFKYTARIESLGSLLDALPADVWLLLDFKPENDGARREQLWKTAAGAVARRGLAARVVACGADSGMFELFRKEVPGGQVGLCNLGAGDSSEIVAAAVKAGADTVVLSGEQALSPANQPTPGLKAARRAAADGTLKLAYVVALTGRYNKDAAAAAQAESSVFALMVESLIEASEDLRPGWLWINESWARSALAGEDVNADIWHLGYAKYNPEQYCHVYPDDGAHVAITDFQGEVEHKLTGDQVKDELHRLLERSWDSNKDWPFYSGGGVGFAPGIAGDFSAEVDVESAMARQATTVEMAALNVDPAPHRQPWKKDDDGALGRDADGRLIPNYPESFRDKDSFFDPHGAPPYVGVEHDEDDGWRINWNLGSEYDSNQYGKPAGDGKLLSGRMRLDRRGAYFAAYYRATGDTSPLGWVCVGAVRNDSLNPRVFLRLAGKRWRQENPAPPPRWMDVIPNHFTFRKMSIRRFPVR